MHLGCMRVVFKCAADMPPIAQDTFQMQVEMVNAVPFVTSGGDGCS